VTVPVGHNQYFDQRMPELIGGGLIALFLKRVSEANEWVEVDLREALMCKYGEPYMYANAVGFLYLNSVEAGRSLTI
jgi:hypothetical protein